MIKPYGIASGYSPKIKAAFVRRKEEYGMAWSGGIYNGETAKDKYTKQLINTSKSVGVDLDLRSLPIFSLAEAEDWIIEAKKENIDGILLETTGSYFLIFY